MEFVCPIMRTRNVIYMFFNGSIVVTLQAYNANMESSSLPNMNMHFALQVIAPILH